MLWLWAVGQHPEWRSSPNRRMASPRAATLKHSGRSGIQRIFPVSWCWTPGFAIVIVIGPEPDPRVNRDNVFLVWNTDQKPTLVLNAIDQTHAFTCGRDLTARIGDLDNVRDTTVFGCFPEFVPSLDPVHVRSSAARLGEIARADADRFIAGVPVDWQV